MPIEMLPCPHCNDGTTNLTIRGFTEECYVQCDPCGTRGPYKTIEGLDNYDKAIKAWNALYRPLRWTKEKPTEAGWYWFKWGTRKENVTIVEYRTISRHTGELIIPQSDLCELNPRWAGPISEPEGE